MDLQINCAISKGQLVTLYGKSGVGKTSILRMLAGLLLPDQGYIKVNDKTWFDHQNNINLSPQKRNLGFVFQDYALFPNMTVKENLSYALGRNGDKKTIDNLIDIIELGDLQKRKPQTLSGGQKQRVALARALVQRPNILLLDEPLAALDQEMRDKLQRYILEVHKEFYLTTILVSHDIKEIIRMSDEVIVLDNGLITHQTTPTKLFRNKGLSGKFQFTGEVNQIIQQGFIYILFILIGNELIQIVVDESDAKNLAVGDKVLIASKSFNPIVKKIN